MGGGGILVKVTAADGSLRLIRLKQATSAAGCDFATEPPPGSVRGHLGGAQPPPAASPSRAVLLRGTAAAGGGIRVCSWVGPLGGSVRENKEAGAAIFPAALI